MIYEAALERERLFTNLRSNSLNGHFNKFLHFRLNGTNWNGPRCLILLVIHALFIF